MKENYVPIRPGLLDHLLRGDISVCELGCYTIIHLQADYKTGIWRGSAARLTNTAPRGADLRRTQRALEHLASLGLLKPFHRQGLRGNYPVLINKYTVRSGALKGQRLNAYKTTDWRRPVYEPCAEDDAVSTAVSDAVDAPIQEVRSKKEERRRKAAAKPAPPADDRYGPFLELAKSSFEAKYGQPPTWDCFGKDGSALAGFLRRAPHITLELWTAHLNAYFDSTEAFTVKQGGSLSYFVSKFDAFTSGPILEKQGAHNGTAKKLTGDDLNRANLRAAGLVQ